MSRWLIGAAACLATLVSCSSTPAPATPPSTAPTFRTLTLGAASGVGPGTVTHSCPDSGEPKTCGPTDFSGVWSVRVDAAVGSTVRVQVAGTTLAPVCWVSDAADQLTFVKDQRTGACSYTVE